MAPYYFANSLARVVSGAAFRDRIRPGLERFVWVKPGGVSTFFINVEEKRKSEKNHKNTYYTHNIIFLFIIFNGVEGEDYALNSDNI